MDNKFVEHRVEQNTVRDFFDRFCEMEKMSKIEKELVYDEFNRGFIFLPFILSAKYHENRQRMEDLNIKWLYRLYLPIKYNWFIKTKYLSIVGLEINTKEFDDGEYRKVINEQAKKLLRLINNSYKKKIMSHD